MSRLSQSKRRRKLAKRPVICPSCGKEAVVEDTAYGKRHMCRACGLWSYNGRKLVNGATHSARIRAHDHFDPLWKSGVVSRGEAYQLLRKILKLSSDDCHFSVMSYEQLKLVPPAVQQIKRYLQGKASGPIDWGA